MTIEDLLVTDLEVDTALADQSVPFAIRAVWHLLRESDVRLGEAVALDLPDVELDRLVIVRSSEDGGLYEAAINATVGGILTELIAGRAGGPVFTEGGRRLRAEEVASRFRELTGKSVHTLSFRQFPDPSTTLPLLLARIASMKEWG